jgi:hypothetical protein
LIVAAGSGEKRPEEKEADINPLNIVAPDETTNSVP